MHEPKQRNESNSLASRQTALREATNQSSKQERVYPHVLNYSFVREPEKQQELSEISEHKAASSLFISRHNSPQRSKEQLASARAN